MKSGINKPRENFHKGRTEDIAVDKLGVGSGHSSMQRLNSYYNARAKDLVDIIADIAPKNNKKKLFQINNPV
jgi:hypothetical protein